MKTVLVVTSPFSHRFEEGGEKVAFSVGDVIDDATRAKTVKALYAAHVVSRAADPPEGDPDHVPPPKPLTAKASGDKE